MYMKSSSLSYINKEKKREEKKTQWKYDMSQIYVNLALILSSSRENNEEEK